MFAERLYYLAETNGWFASIQAGFRRGYSCVDQIIRLSQAIEDGFQQKPFHRSIMVLLDYSKAFDTVWRSKLLLAMTEKGVPIEYVAWIESFLRNRQAQVRLHGTTSSSRKLHQGVPQGCVLSPLLFLFFIDNLAQRLISADPARASKLVFSIFADDVTILARSRSIEEATREAQWAVNIVKDWSRKWKLELNASKSEVCYFSSSTKTEEALFRPEIKIGKATIPFNPHPKLLGVTFDRSLTFRNHAENVAKTAVGKTKILAAVSNTEWGWRKDHLTQLFYAHVRSVVDYSSPGWQPWLSPTNIKLIQSAQNKALRIITGQLKCSPIEALHYETGVELYSTRIKRLTLRSAEKAKRNPENHPSAIALSSAIPSRNKRRSWARLANELSEFIPPDAEQRTAIAQYEKPPWSTMSNVSIFSDLEGISNKNDDQAKIRSAAIAAIEKWDSNLTIFTDGSAVEGCRQGGAAAVIKMHHEDPPISETVMSKGAPYTSSFEEECTAMELAVNWIKDNCSPASRPLIITDSQSLCKALVGYDHAVSHLRNLLSSCDSTIGIQWVPGHCGIPGNEDADQAANAARTISGPQRSTTLKGIIPLIKRHITDPPCRSDHSHIATIYGKISKNKEKQITSRWDQVELARLRSGHHWDLRSYLHRIDEDIDATCPRCKQADDTSMHLFECAGTMAARHEIFGTVEVSPSALTEHPQRALALARRSLRGAGARPQDRPPDGSAQ